jgi:primosomal protein N'
VSAIKENESKDLALNILKLLSNNDKIEIYGPAPAPIHRLKNRYHFLLHIKLDKKINAQKLVNDIKNKISISSKFRVKINFL